MIDSQAKLIDPLVGEKVTKVPTRNGLGDGLLEAGTRDERIVAVCADLTESVRMQQFAEAFPERFVQVGVAEQNLVAVGSGLAAVGKIPFVSSYAAFSPGRNWEQIRTTICYNDQPVKIMGSHAGLLVGPDGATHQMLEDLTLMRVLPNMTVLSPCDYQEAKKAVLAAAATRGPVYIRLAREKTPVFTTEATPFEIGKAGYWRKGTGLTIVATGPLSYQALLAAEELDAEFINVSSLKPFDSDTLLESVAKTGLVLTVEEHQIIGGLGGVVAEVLAESMPTKVVRMGVYDQFGESGDPFELWEHFGLTTPHIVAKGKQLLETS